MIEQLLLIRHGESAGNVARERALASGAALIDIAQRDADVPLSDLGRRQARSLGAWLAREDRMPNAIVCSPFVRAHQTAQLAAQHWQPEVPISIDERLREKEFGMLDRFTRSGIEQKFPEQAEMRVRLGKFYYRPPGGESWADVILRLRSVWNDIAHANSGRVAIVSHQVVVLCMRYIIEGLNEAQLLEIDRQGDVANCSVTSYVRGEQAPHALRLEHYNLIEPVASQGETVTSEPDAAVAPK